MTDDPNRIPIGDRMTIYRRGAKGTWVADFWQDGTHRRVSLRTTNKKAALEKAVQLAAGLAGGRYHRPPPAVPLGQAVAEYLTHVQSRGRADKTQVKYRGVLRRFVEYLSDHRVTRLDRVTAGQFDRYQLERRRIRDSNTVFHEGVIIKQLFRWAVGRKLLSEDPLAGVRLDKPKREPRGGPSLAQVDALLAAAEEPLRGQLAVLAFTGMRSGELQRLRPEDVELAGGWVHIRSRPGAETKTRESRKVPVHPRLRAVLAGLPRSRRSWLFVAEPRRDDGVGDRPICGKQLNAAFGRLAGRLGMSVGRAGGGFVIHSFRHFFETFTVNAGIPQRAVDAWLGHRSDRSMGAWYYRLSDEESQRHMVKVPFGTGTPAADAGQEEERCSGS